MKFHSINWSWAQPSTALCSIWGPYGHSCDEYSALGCNAVHFGDSPTFLWDMSPLSSSQLAACFCWLLTSLSLVPRYIPPRWRAVSNLHGATTQNAIAPVLVFNHLHVCQANCNHAIAVSCYVMPGSFIDEHQSFGGICCLHLQCKLEEACPFRIFSTYTLSYLYSHRGEDHKPHWIVARNPL
jgi:hypothetical protein